MLTLPQIKRGIVLFWALWLSLVLTTNTMDAARALGLLDETWRFASGNFGFVANTTRAYGTPTWVNAALFAGVLLWQTAAVALLWRAFARFGPGGRGRAEADGALGVLLALWCAFLLADEVFVSYAAAGTHASLFIATLASLLALHLLPEGPPAANPAEVGAHAEKERAAAGTVAG